MQRREFIRPRPEKRVPPSASNPHPLAAPFEQFRQANARSSVPGTARWDLRLERLPPPRPRRRIGPAVPSAYAFRGVLSWLVPEINRDQDCSLRWLQPSPDYLYFSPIGKFCPNNNRGIWFASRPLAQQRRTIKSCNNLPRRYTTLFAPFVGMNRDDEAVFAHRFSYSLIVLAHENTVYEQCIDTISCRVNRSTT